MKKDSSDSFVKRHLWQFVGLIVAFTLLASIALSKMNNWHFTNPLDTKVSESLTANTSFVDYLKKNEVSSIDCSVLKSPVVEFKDGAMIGVVDSCNNNSYKLIRESATIKLVGADDQLKTDPAFVENVKTWVAHAQKLKAYSETIKDPWEEKSVKKLKF